MIVHMDNLLSFKDGAGGFAQDPGKRREGNIGVWMQRALGFAV